jgi:hypothetical protein
MTTADVVTLIFTHTASVAAGVVATLIAKRLRLRGKIRFRVDKWEFYPVARDSFGGEGPGQWDTAEEAAGRARVAFFSEKEANSALHGITVEFRSRKNVRASAKPFIRATSEDWRANAVHIGLAPREWTEASFSFRFESPQFAALRQADSAWLVGFTPENKRQDFKLADLLRS